MGIYLVTACCCYNICIIESGHDLFTKESRIKWEQQFSTMYVQPILNNMGSKLQTAQELITNDDKQSKYRCVPY